MDGSDGDRTDVCVGGKGTGHMLPPSITPSHLLPSQTANTKAGLCFPTLLFQNVTLQWGTDWGKTAFLEPACISLSWTVTEDRMCGDREFEFHFQVTHTSMGHIIPGIRLFLLSFVCLWWIDADLYFMGLLSRQFLWYHLYWPNILLWSSEPILCWISLAETTSADPHAKDRARNKIRKSI